MSANTTRANLPYPVGTDRVMDGDDAIRGLAERLDGSAAGPVSVPYSEAGGTASFGMTAATNATVAVTYPAGRFSVSPLVVAVASGSASSVMFASVTAKSATGCSITIRNYQELAITGTFLVDWQAKQNDGGGCRRIGDTWQR